MSFPLLPPNDICVIEDAYKGGNLRSFNCRVGIWCGCSSIMSPGCICNCFHEEDTISMIKKCELYFKGRSKVKENFLCVNSFFSFLVLCSAIFNLKEFIQFCRTCNSSNVSQSSDKFSMPSELVNDLKLRLRKSLLNYYSKVEMIFYKTESVIVAPLSRKQSLNNIKCFEYNIHQARIKSVQRIRPTDTLDKNQSSFLEDVEKKKTKTKNKSHMKKKGRWFLSDVTEGLFRWQDDDDVQEDFEEYTDSEIEFNENNIGKCCHEIPMLRSQPKCDSVVTEISEVFNDDLSRSRGWIEIVDNMSCSIDDDWMVIDD